jgi:hypothetical protein
MSEDVTTVSVSELVARVRLEAEQAYELAVQNQSTITRLKAAMDNLESYIGNEEAQQRHNAMLQQLVSDNEALQKRVEDLETALAEQTATKDALVKVGRYAMKLAKVTDTELEGTEPVTSPPVKTPAGTAVYIDSKNEGDCSWCKQPVVWFQLFNNKHNKKIPYNTMPVYQAVEITGGRQIGYVDTSSTKSHLDTCPAKPAKHVAGGSHEVQ